MGNDLLEYIFLCHNIFFVFIIYLKYSHCTASRQDAAKVQYVAKIQLFSVNEVTRTHYESEI
jgi:hypothetical protein